MGIIINNDSQPISVHTHTVDVTKANPYKDGATGRFTTGGGGVVAITPRSPGQGMQPNSEREARQKTYNSEKKKMNESLDRAKKLNDGYSDLGFDADITNIKRRHQAEDVSGLEDAETYFIEAHADYSRGGGSAQIEVLEQLHTGTVHALRSLTGKGKETYPTIEEMGGS